MSDAWAVVVAGLGGSLVTGATTVLIFERQETYRLSERARAERSKAYSALLGHSTMVLFMAGALHQTMQARSGIGEGADAALGVRKPIDALELWLAMRDDFGGMNAAWSEVWTVGSPAGIQLANALVDACRAVIDSGTARGGLPLDWLTHS